VDRVVIGMDPHKRSVTIEVMAADETIVGGGRFGTDAAGYRSLLRYVKQWPERVWAIEGCQGIGRHVANRLLADGEEVVDVPPKLSARARVFTTGQGRKTDATDAHSVALVGTRMAGLRPVVNDEQLAVLRLLVDRRRALGEDHTRTVNQLHELLLELIPGGAKKNISAAQAKALLAKVRPRDAAGKARRRVAAELIADLERIYKRKKAADKEPEGTRRRHRHVADGPTRHGSLRRRPTARGRRRHHPLRHQGPLRLLERHRTHRRLLRRPGAPPAFACWEPKINRTLHIMTTVQLRNPTKGRAYYDRKIASGKGSMEAMRCLKRRLSDIVYRRMLDDAITQAVTGPGGHRGTSTDSSVTDSHPHAGSSEKSLPGPATTQPRTPAATAG
jgi:transposase